MIERERIPPPRRWGNMSVWDSYEIELLAARVFGLPLPKKPEKTVLLNVKEVAERLRLRPASVLRRVRIERREAAAQAPGPEAA